MSLWLKLGVWKLRAAVVALMTVLTVAGAATVSAETDPDSWRLENAPDSWRLD